MTPQTDLTALDRLIVAAERYAERILRDAPDGTMSTVTEMWRMLAADARAALASLAGAETPQGTDRGGIQTSSKGSAWQLRTFAHLSGATTLQSIAIRRRVF